MLSRRNNIWGQLGARTQPPSGLYRAGAVDRFPSAICGKAVDDEDSDRDVGQRPDRVVGHPPDGADGEDPAGDDADPTAELGTREDAERTTDQDEGDDEVHPAIGAEAAPEQCPF